MRNPFDRIKITELPTLQSAEEADWTIAVDVSDKSGGPQGTTKKATRSDFKGDKGDQGIQGDKGETGASIVDANFRGNDIVFSKDDTTEVVLPGAKQDLRGEKGEKGDIGDVGPQGDQGAQGLQGAKGDKGDRGEKGDAATVAAGTTTTGAPGTNASVTQTGTPNNRTFDFTIPRGDKGEKGDKGDQGERGAQGEKGDRGEKGDKGDTGNRGLNWRGEWSTATTYAVGDGVTHNRSSYIAVSSNQNSEPPSSNWDLLAPHGEDGEGTVTSIEAGDGIDVDSLDPNNPKVELNSATKSALAKANSAVQTETDPTVPAWAKAQSKPSYTKAEVGLGNVDNTADTNKPVSTPTQNALNNKVDKVAGKGLSTEDYTTTEKNKLAGIQAGAQVNTVTSVAGKAGAVVLIKSDVGLGNVDNTADSAKPVSTAQQTALNAKANLNQTMGVVTGGNASTARPTGFSSVTWVQAVEPNNAINNDVWIDTSV